MSQEVTWSGKVVDRRELNKEEEKQEEEEGKIGRFRFICSMKSLAISIFCYLVPIPFLTTCPKQTIPYEIFNKQSSMNIE